MGNRHGGDKAAAKEEKEEKKRKKKEKKAKKKQKKKGGVGSDVDLDPESSQFSRADSESLVFHSAENLSPYLDASTRSEEGAACAGFYDNGHVLSSKDFHDGFSIEACLPADLAAFPLMSDVTGDVTKMGDDVTSMASGVYSTPLLSSPDVRRGIPRSPLAQRQKDSFMEPVPPIPSDFSSNTLSSVSYQEGVSTPGTQRSSSRASSSTVDTNAAHCIERLEELERNIERAIIEKFAPVDQAGSPQGTSSENATPRLVRRADFRSGERSREGSMTPRGVGPDGALAQSPDSSPAIVRKISEPCWPPFREGSTTPKGVIQGVWSQSAENSPVIVRKALPNPESPVILRRTPSQSPTVERKFPANAPESPIFYRQAVNVADSPSFSPSSQRRVPLVSPERSPQIARREPPVPESSGVIPQKAKVPPPVPPKPVVNFLTYPEVARRLQSMPKSPIMQRKVYAFQEHQTTDHSQMSRDDPWDRNWRQHQMPPRSPSRSPEVRHRVTRKTPSSSPSPKSLVRKLMPQEDRAPPPVTTPPAPPTQIQFCQQERGIPVKHCTLATQPSTAVVLGSGSTEGNSSEVKPHIPSDTKHSETSISQTKHSEQDRATHEEVSEDAIKKSSESAVFGSVSPKLKRQKKILSANERGGSFDHQRQDSLDSSTRSPPCSPQISRSRPLLSKTHVHEGSDLSASGSTDSPDQSPARRRAQFRKQASQCKDDGSLSADIAGGLTYHSHTPSDDVSTQLSNQEMTGPHDDVYSAIHTDSETSQGALIGGSTVMKSGTGWEDFTGREQHFTTITDTREGEEGEEGKGRACWGKEETQQQQQQRVAAAAGAAACQRVPSPPPFQPDSPTTSGGKTISKSLGQRIRDVIINESTTFREVFTAELSSSSVEKDDGAYTSDDSVFVARGSPHPPHPHLSHPHHQQCAAESGRECVEPRASDSPLSSPRITRAGQRQQCAGSPQTAGHPTQPPQSTPQPPGHGGSSTTQHSHDFLVQHVPVTHVTPPLVHHHHVPVSLPPESTAIRRIDIDVNVTLPQLQGQVGVTSTSPDDPYPLATDNLPYVPTPRADDGGHGSDVMDSAQDDPDQDNCHSSSPSGMSVHIESCETGAKTTIDKREVAESGRKTSTPSSSSSSTTQEKTTNVLQQSAMATTTHSEEGRVLPEAEKNVREHEMGEKLSPETTSDISATPSQLPSASAPGFQTTHDNLTAEERERRAQGDGAADFCFVSENRSGSDEATLPNEGSQLANGDNINTVCAQPLVPTSEPVLVQTSQPHLSSHPPASEPSQTPQALDANPQDSTPADSNSSPAKQTTADCQQQGDATLKDHVPPPSPTAMDTLAEEEEEEEEEEEVDHLVNAHQDSDISSKISQEMQLFGERVVRRLSSLLESQASESDSCIEEGRTDLLRNPARQRKPAGDESSHQREPQFSEHSALLEQQQTDSSSRVDGGVVEDSAHECLDSSSAPHLVDIEGLGQEVGATPPKDSKEDIEPILHEELNTFSTADLPGERLVASDTTETLSTDHETSASSKRESTTSTATDETLTSFKTRSTDSAEFDEAFILPESLVFVRSVNEGVEGEGAVVEAGRIVKRPAIPAQLTRHGATSETTTPHKPRKKRRRQVGSYDVSTRPDVNEPEPKRGSKQIQEVIDAYCDDMSDGSDISSSTDDILSDEVVHKTTYSRSEQQPRAPTSIDLEHRTKDIVRKPKPPADRSTDSSDESGEMEGKRQSSSSHDSSFRIPEIEETFGELMGVKTFLEDLEDKTPTSEPLPVLAGAEKLPSKDFVLATQHRRRSKTSPARTDRTESDLDVSEHRDDASTDSMYADDEDEGTELLFQRSYSEEHGGEVVLSCTIYNSSHDNDGDSDEFWADAEAAAASDQNYKTLETAADAAGSAFQNARIQMHDIHQHLQDLRRQMELLQDDITSTSLTLTPDYSLESEQRPVTE